MATRVDKGEHPHPGGETGCRGDGIQGGRASLVVGEARARRLLGDVGEIGAEEDGADRRHEGRIGPVVPIPGAVVFLLVSAQRSTISVVMAHRVTHRAHAPGQLPWSTPGGSQLTGRPACLEGAAHGAGDEGVSGVVGLETVRGHSVHVTGQWLAGIGVGHPAAAAAALIASV